MFGVWNTSGMIKITATKNVFLEFFKLQIFEMFLPQAVAKMCPNILIGYSHLNKTIILYISGGL